jgi:hypothetical protein
MCPNQSSLLLLISAVMSGCPYIFLSTIWNIPLHSVYYI